MNESEGQERIDRERLIQFTASVSSDEFKQIEEIGRARRWSRAKAAGYLINLGLLTEKQQQVSAQESQGTANAA